MKKSILYFIMILGFSIGMTSCSTDAYDVEIENTAQEVVSYPLMNKDGDGTVEEGGVNEEGDSTDPIYKPKKD